MQLYAYYWVVEPIISTVVHVDGACSFGKIVFRRFNVSVDFQILLTVIVVCSVATCGSRRVQLKKQFVIADLNDVIKKNTFLIFA